MTNSISTVHPNLVAAAHSSSTAPVHFSHAEAVQSSASSSSQSTQSKEGKKLPGIHLAPDLAFAGIQGVLCAWMRKNNIAAFYDMMKASKEGKLPDVGGKENIAKRIDYFSKYSPDGKNLADFLASQNQRGCDLTRKLFTKDSRSFLDKLADAMEFTFNAKMHENAAHDSLRGLTISKNGSRIRNSFRSLILNIVGLGKTSKKWWAGSDVRVAEWLRDCKKTPVPELLEPLKGSAGERIKHVLSKNITHAGGIGMFMVFCIPSILSAFQTFGTGEGIKETVRSFFSSFASLYISGALEIPLALAGGAVGGMVAGPVGFGVGALIGNFAGMMAGFGLGSQICENIFKFVGFSLPEASKEDEPSEKKLLTPELCDKIDVSPQIQPSDPVELNKVRNIFAAADKELSATGTLSKNTVDKLYVVNRDYPEFFTMLKSL